MPPSRLPTNLVRLVLAEGDYSFGWLAAISRASMYPDRL